MFPHFKLPVQCVPQEIVNNVSSLEDANGRVLAIGEKQHIDDIADVLNAGLHRTDETPGEYNAVPEIGEEDPMFCISDDGAEFLAAISRLDEEPNVSHDYLGWTTAQDNVGYFRGWKGKFYVSTVTARDLITAIHTLETNGVTNPDDGTAVELPDQE